jgi:asparagine synthase (glutamine-hydrolysing)
MLRYNAHEENELYFTNPEEDFLNQVLLCELKKKLVEDGLHIEDRMSMAWSLESRVPYLDKDLVEYCLNIPAHLKIRKGVKKYVFKQALKNVLPPHIINRSKRGFGFNPYLQFQKDLKQVAERVLNKERIIKQDIFNYKYIHKILHYPPHFRLRWHYFFLWNLIGFQIWYDMFLIRDPSKIVSFNLEDYCYE